MPMRHWPHVIGLGLAILGLCGCGQVSTPVPPAHSQNPGPFSRTPHPVATSSKPTPSATPEANAPPVPQSPNTLMMTVTLPVHPVAAQTTLPASWTYPPHVTVRVPAAWRFSIGAYGALGWIIIAPAGWLGTATMGADGNGTVILTPTGQANPHANVTLTQDPACVTCAAADAAPYFPWIRAHWRTWNPASSPPPALQGTEAPLGPGLVAYRVATPASLATNGIAFSGLVPGAPATAPTSRWGAFVRLQVTLPPADLPLETAILNDFLALQPPPR